MYLRFVFLYMICLQHARNVLYPAGFSHIYIKLDIQRQMSRTKVETIRLPRRVIRNIKKK